MHKRIFIVGFLMVAGSCASHKEITKTPTPNLFDFEKIITAEGLKADLSILAHDSLQGRDAASAGEDKAARYLAKRYKTLGLKPVGDDGTYFQKFEVKQTVLNKIDYKLTKAGEIVDESGHSETETGNFLTMFSGNDPIKGEVVFCGNGMVDESAGINQYPADVKDKWLLVFFDRKAPGFMKIQKVVQKGHPAGVLMISGENEEEFLTNAELAKAKFGKPSGMELAYLDGNSFMSASSSWNRINPALAAKILGLNSTDDLGTLSQEISDDPASFSPRELGYVLEQTPYTTKKTLYTKNVAALIEGNDPVLKDDIVVLSAHYDHVGIGTPDSTGDAIYNGADDDGSGTVGVLHAAQAMLAAKKAGSGPKRSVLFLHVTGEEKGLLGSRYYSDHPLFPIENTIADINVDMIGRLDEEHLDDPNYVYVIGGEIISSGLDSLLQKANKESTNLDLSKRYNDLNDPNQFYRRSDHWNFGRLGVPFVFFFNGVHPDYHRPSDEVEKINFEALTNRTKLLFVFTSYVANTDVRPKVDNQEFIEATKRVHG